MGSQDESEVDLDGRECSGEGDAISEGDADHEFDANSNSN